MLTGAQLINKAFPCQLKLFLILLVSQVQLNSYVVSNNLEVLFVSRCLVH